MAEILKNILKEQLFIVTDFDKKRFPNLSELKGKILIKNKGQTKNKASKTFVETKSTIQDKPSKTFF
jgi:hypothetical protein